jgi:hypothetical protein
MVGSRANSPEVDDHLWRASIQRIIERLLELRGVRPVEVSVKHEHLCLIAGQLGAKAALLGHTPSLRWRLVLKPGGL